MPKYVCEYCKKIWGTEASAIRCETQHLSIADIAVIDAVYDEGAKWVYPERLIVRLSLHPNTMAEYRFCREGGAGDFGGGEPS